MREEIQVLLVEDNEADCELMIRALRRYGYEPAWTRIYTEQAFLAALDSAPDIILADYSLPSFDGMRALQLVQNRGLRIPFLLVSGVLRDEFVVAAIKLGADDFIVKDNLSRLGPAVASAMKNRELRESFFQAEAERLAADVRTRQFANKQAAILDSLPANIALLDSHGVVVVVNQSWKQFALENGLKYPEFGLGANYISICKRATGKESEEAQNVAQGIEQVLLGESEGFAAEYSCDSPTEKRWFRVTASQLSNCPESGAVIMHVNITERKLAVDALRKSEQEQRQLAEQLNTQRRRLLEAQAVAKMGSWETDLHNLEVNWSGETYRIFGTSPKHFQPTHSEFLKLVHPEDREAVEEAFVRSFRSTTTNSIEHRLLLAGGIVKHVEERWHIFRDEFGNPIRAVGTCRDVTEQRALQQQLLQSQKMEAIGKLAAGVAHDFNNLLTVILGYTDILKNKTPTTDPNWSMLSDIDFSASRAANLTRQLLSFSRQQVLNPQILDLNAGLAELKKLLQRLIGEDIAMEFNLQPLSKRIRMDPSQLEQVIINLVVNARDAMPLGGVLTIETAETEIDSSNAERLSGKAGLYLSLSVADSGTGMTDAVKSRIFEPYFTTKEPGKGSGIGLATIFGIVKQSDGLINVESQVGVGTRFQILLPAVHGSAQTSVQAAEKPSLKGRETILLVEDDAILRRATQYILASQGYRVRMSANGKQALELVKSTCEPLHLVITDVVMPVMNGRVLVEQLRADHPQLKTLYVSGYTDDQVVKHGVSASEDPFLQKPFTPQILLQKVREVLDS